ncbi:MAG: glycoside hydrolase family 5 protein [Saccharofermentans sp.]|nr:glycoside hydrolase family 5 protein [Saccharofermentans sp.]
MKGILRGSAVLGLAGAFLLCSCSANLGPETLPSTTPATETFETVPEETEEPEETVAPEATEPSSFAVVTDRIAEDTGSLKVDGTKITDSEGEIVVLKGISSFGIEDCDDFFSAETVKTLAEDWGCDVLRIAVTGDANSDGYLYNPDMYFDMVCKICDMCIDQGIYVIIDWGVMYIEDYGENKDTAVDFFRRLSVIYPDSPYVIYEVNNYPIPVEDVDEDMDEWEDIIKPFATDVIDAIRENSSNSIIIVGVPDRGLDIVTAAESWLDYSNICYGCHIFSGSNRQEMRDKITEALDNEICVFVSEWSFCTEDCKGGIFTGESDKWADFFDENDISWCNYAVGSNIDNDTNALLMNSDKYTFEQKYDGHWPDGLLSKSGLYARDLLLKVPSEPEDTEQTEDTSDDED